MSIDSLESLNLKISELYEEYKNDEYVLNKLIQYINNDLPALLINTKKQQKSREDRKSLLTEGHDKFVSEFINKNMFFYCSTTELFFKYDNKNYNIIKEDDIIYYILSSLSHRDNAHQQEYYEQQLLPWKFKIKTSIIKQLREITLFKSIPESITIQRVMRLFTDIFFTSRNEVKYFLIILGDAILKKTNSNIYLISPIAKVLIRLLENEGAKYFGHISLLNVFRYKYHDHPYSDCRLINIKNLKQYDEMYDQIYEPLQKNIINIFVVCCHYSNRYENADKYLNTIEDTSLKNYALYLKNNDPKAIINQFIQGKIQTSEDSIITTKNMLYLWKCYLDENNISGVIFTTNFKAIIKENLKYDTENDCFTGYTSLGLPLVSNFVKFWDSTMKENTDEYFLEIDEICILFKRWLGGKSALEIKDCNILNLIRHYYPDINIDKNKYILGVSCTLWNKKDDIKDFLSKCTDDLSKSDDDNNKDLTIYELYSKYSNKYSKKNNITISKSYFDLYMAEYSKDS